MAYEIDFLAVGDGEKSGDAIALRYGNLSGTRSEQTVMIVDGGTKASGEALVSHVRTYYGTNSVDYVVSTHPDLDHASGLSVTLEELDFGTLVMHRPWEHASFIKEAFSSGRITATGLEEKLRKELEAAHTLEEIAFKKNRQIVEPFAGVGTPDGTLLFLGPTIDYYRSMLCQFRCAPDVKQAGIFQKAAITFKEAANYVLETMQFETLKDPEGVAENTSSENNSSALLLITLEGKRILLTADAGFEALLRAADFAWSKGIDLATLTFLQVPHHGSRRNVGPTVLNRIKAPTAFISVGPSCEPKHPSKKVTNALRRRGASVFVTKGQNIWHRSLDAPLRATYSDIQPLPFYSQVED